MHHLQKEKCIKLYWLKFKLNHPPFFAGVNVHIKIHITQLTLLLPVYDQQINKHQKNKPLDQACTTYGPPAKYAARGSF
jgi:hypothetical protein